MTPLWKKLKMKMVNNFFLIFFPTAFIHLLKGQESGNEEISKGISFSMNRNKKELSHLGNRKLTNNKIRSHTATYSPQQLAGLSITMQDFEYALPYA